MKEISHNTSSAALTTENLRNTMVTMDAMKTANKEIRKQLVGFLPLFLSGQFG